MSVVSPAVPMIPTRSMNPIVIMLGHDALRSDLDFDSVEPGGHLDDQGTHVPADVKHHRTLSCKRILQAHGFVVPGFVW